MFELSVNHSDFIRARSCMILEQPDPLSTLYCLLFSFQMGEAPSHSLQCSGFFSFDPHVLLRVEVHPAALVISRARGNCFSQSFDFAKSLGRVTTAVKPIRPVSKDQRETNSSHAIVRIWPRQRRSTNANQPARTQATASQVKRVKRN